MIIEIEKNYLLQLKQDVLSSTKENYLLVKDWVRVKGTIFYYSDSLKTLMYEYIPEKEKPRKKKYSKTKKDIIKNALYRYEQRSIKKGFEFNLDFDFIKDFYKKDCFYCGRIIKNICIDRKNNNVGYIKTNIVSCCVHCNSKKGTKDFNYFLNEIKTLKES